MKTKGMPASTTALKAQRLDLALDNLAELISGASLKSEVYFKAHRDFVYSAGRAEHEALSDSLRRTLIDAVTLLAQVELDYPEVWQHNNWADVCDAMARRLETDGIVTVEWLKTQLEGVE